MVYNLGERIEAFSTEKTAELDFPVVLPLHQAHGTRVVRITERLMSLSTFSAGTEASQHTCEELTGCDALITDIPGLRIGVKTADCVPILVYDSGKQAVAAIHSGWRGTVANIISVTIRAMQDAFSTCPADCRAVIGPCIHLEAFEVGDQLYDTFRKAGYGIFCQRLPHPETDIVKWHIDLPAICRQQLEDSGVRDVYVSPICTYENHDRYYSARRLGAAFGKQRILNCIMLRN